MKQRRFGESHWRVACEAVLSDEQRERLLVETARLLAKRVGTQRLQIAAALAEDSAAIVTVDEQYTALRRGDGTGTLWPKEDTC